MIQFFGKLHKHIQNIYEQIDAFILIKNELDRKNILFTIEQIVHLLRTEIKEGVFMRLSKNQ